MTRQSAARALRVLIFTDVNVDITAALISQTLRLTRASGPFRVCGIVTSCPERFRDSRALRVLRSGRRALIAATDPDVPIKSIASRRLDLVHMQRETGIPVLTPPRGGVNGREFLRRLDHEVRPHVALSFFCLSIFRDALLRRFEQCINFHDALLPQRKGLMATSFSLYHGDPATGVTFHRMTKDIDGGPILVQRSIPVGDSEPFAAVRRRQVAAAQKALPEVLDLVARGHPRPSADRAGRLPLT